MKLAYVVESVHTAALRLEFHSVPWDTDILAVPTAQISRLEVIDAAQARTDYSGFTHWRDQHDIQLCACRLPANNLAESMFLEEHGFRFIELNYLPRLENLQKADFGPAGGVIIQRALETDMELLADMAGRIFSHGRFHQDPRIDSALGDKRYRTWMINAFSHPTQEVWKCIINGEIVAFFVLEMREQRHCFWSLVGLAPGFSGRGLAKRVWRAMLTHHREGGVEIVSTSISSHNVPVFNLYVSLGFRFPQPLMTLQWLRPRLGQIV